MNETYSTERQMAVNALRDELVYMEQELAVIKEQGAYLSVKVSDFRHIDCFLSQIVQFHR